ncbi:MAG: copper chaperone PCu(A)C [Chloroflexi bacterium]|nr:MAG: copper chaperone PCu(A)C [Chloroflexota bacterium]MBL1197383.1 copper chaperone PCu(A)C [Chloroflexota bacterium]NOH14679.1 copper chaperone PCu(A)C [Chloroflexota bacterium]
MRRSIYPFTASFVLTIILVGCSSPGELSISQAWARPATAGNNGAVYFMVENPTSQEDALINVRSRVADAAEVHLSIVSESGVVSMEPQETVHFAPDSQVEFAPGGLHVMLIRLNQDLFEGDVVELILEFERAGEIEIMAPIGEP